MEKNHFLVNAFDVSKRLKEKNHSVIDNNKDAVEDV